MIEKPVIDIRRHLPRKITSKYWVKFAFYAGILGALFFWYKHKETKTVKIENGVQQNQLEIKGVIVEE